MRLTEKELKRKIEKNVKLAAKAWEEQRFAIALQMLDRSILFLRNPVLKDELFRFSNLAGLQMNRGSCFFESRPAG